MQDNRMAARSFGTIRTDPSSLLYERLKVLYDGLRSVVSESRPDNAAMESVFVARNPSSALKLGHARGALLLALVHSGLEIHDYSPTEVKQAVVGTGRAEKSQVAQMVSFLLGLPEPPAADAADALAVAICHLMHRPLRANADHLRRNSLK